MNYVVTAPLVIAKSETGADLYVYKDGRVPAGQTDEWVENHLRDKMIAEAPADADGDTSTDEKPKGNSSEEAWRAYAVTQGMSQEQADGMSRDELRDYFG